MDEAALIAAARDDPDAFARLYDRTLPEVYRFALSLTRDHVRAEDVTGETYRRALAHITRYEDRGRPFVAWLFSIARNLVRDGARRRGREAPLLDFDRPVEDWPGEALIRDEAQAAIRRAVRALPRAQQRVVVLRFGHGWSCRDVGDRMGKSEAAVKQLSYRAMNRLREILWEEGYER